MRDIGMNFCCLPAAGNCAAVLNGCINFLTGIVLILTQTRLNWSGLHRVLICWAYGLPPRGPP